MSPRISLQQRGIAEIAEKFGWVGKPDGYWHYPVWDAEGKVIATRAKAFPNTQQAKDKKYYWPDGKPNNPAADWYTPPGTLEAIEAAGGVAYLANGEAALLAFHAAGIYNVIATCHGENTVPKNTDVTLQSFRIATLINIPDKDEAGVKAAAKWRDALLNSDIGYQAKQWPDYLPEKSDFNDLWIHVAFDAQAARKALNECQALILPQPAVKTPVLPDLPRGEAPSSLIDALVSELRARGHRKQNKEWLNGLSIFREEDNASAGLNTKNGVYYDFGNGESYNPIETAEKLGIDWKRFYPEKPAKKAKARPDSSLSLHETPNAKKDVWALEIEQELEKQQAEEKAEFVSYEPKPKAKHGGGWIDQDELPIAWVKALLHLCHAKSAVPVYAILFHRAIRNGLVNPKAFTISQVMEALETPRLSTTDFIDYCCKIHLCMDSDTQVVNEELPIHAKSIQKGRPAHYYAVNEDTVVVVDTLIELLRPCLLERLADKELAPVTESVMDALNWDFAEWIDWMKNHENPKQQHIARLIEEKLVDLLVNRSSYDFSPADLETTAALRGKMVKIALAPYSERTITNGDGAETVIPREGIQLSRAKLALELGNSESSMAKLFKDNHIGTKRVKGWIEVENANGADIEKELREAPSRLNSSLGGVAIGISLKVWDAGAERRIKLSYGALARANYRKWDGRIMRMDILVEQPSLLWNMTAAEIAEKQAKEAEKTAMELEASEVSENAPIAPKIASEATEAPKAKAPRKISFTRGKDRTRVGHDPEWLQKQLAMRVHVHTASYRLENLSILSASNEVIATLETQAAVMSWVKRYGSKQFMRTVESFYQPTIFTPIPSPIAQPVPAKVAAPALEDEGINWAENVELFYERMRALGG